MITKREAAVISAYTGFLLGDFADMHEYAEELFDRPIWTHEFAGEELADKLKNLARPDFMLLPVEGSKNA